MAQIIIDIPDDKAADVRDAFAATYGWTAESNLTKTQFAKAQVAKYVKDVYQAYQAEQAAITARNDSLTQTGQVIIT